MTKQDFFVINELDKILYLNNQPPTGTISCYDSKSGLPRFELIYKLKGETNILFDSVNLKSSAGTVYILPKHHGQKYRTQTVVPGECIDVFFDIDTNIFNKATIIKTNASKEIRMLFVELSRIWFRKDIGYYYEAMSVLYKILRLLFSSDATPKHLKPHYKKIKPAIEHLNEVYCMSDLDYEAIASLCNMSYSYFRRLFTECMGISPAKYVTQKRIEYAKELLSSSQYKISEVAEITGFCDVYYFSRIFKLHTGLSPSKYTHTETSYPTQA